MITIIVASIILTMVFYVKDRSFVLGIITLVPVILVIAWVFGSMYLMGMPLNVLTIMISSMTVGIGVDYAIHITHRFVEDMKEYDSIEKATNSTVVNTGKALFGAAGTTIGGFGMLYFAPIPPMNMFGTLSAVSIFFSLVSCSFVLPAFLTVWAKAVMKKNPDFFRKHGDVGKSTGNDVDEPTEKDASKPVEKDPGESAAQDEVEKTGRVGNDVKGIAGGPIVDEQAERAGEQTGEGT